MNELKGHSEWVSNPVTQKIMNRLQSELAQLRKQHDSANYTDLKEVAVVQAKISERQRFIDDVFVTGRVMQENYKEQEK